MNQELISDLFLKELKEQTSDIFFRAPKILYFQAGLEELGAFGANRFLAVLQTKEILNDYKIGYHFQEILKKLDVLPVFESLVKEILTTLVKKEVLNVSRENIYKLTSDNFLKPESFELRQQELSKKYPELKLNINFLDVLLKNYMSILSGDSTFLNFLFPDGSFELVTDLYCNNPEAEYYNLLTAKVVRFFSKNYCSAANKIKIMEIGAGIGSTTEAVLSSLDNQSIHEYCYTDISRAFLGYGAKKFQNGFGFLKFSRFDFNQALEKQELYPDGYDIVFATNALHNAKNLKESLKAIFTLLRSGGVLILNEGVIKNSYSTLVYGLSPTWWGAVDAGLRIQGSPLLNLTQWKFVLNSAKFREVFSVNEIFELDSVMNQDIIIAIK